jgi:anhydro-N-acetylmuramic acid kinase
MTSSFPKRRKTVLEDYSETTAGYIVGVMSGTSLDGVDMCLCELTGSASRVLAASGDNAPASTCNIYHAPLSVRVVHFSTAPFPTDGPFGAIKPCLKRAMSLTESAVDGICDINFNFSRFVAKGILDFLREVDELQLLPFSAYEDRLERIAIGSHGQTVWHSVVGGSTLQLGDTEVLAHLTDMVCVGNFRAADVAVGGQGAPLVPFFDSVVARLNKMETVCFQNLGGIGNVTYVSPTSCIAFDTGPANVTMNELLDVLVALPADHPLASLSNYILESLGLPQGSSMFDRNAVFSGNGVVIEALLDEWLNAPGVASFRSQPPPKSTGRELFGNTFAREHVLTKIESSDNVAEMLQSFYNVMRTLVRLSAVLVAESYRQYLPCIPADVVVSGGGRRHPLLLEDIRILLTSDHHPVLVRSLGDLVSVPNTIDADDAKEAIAFAVFAHERLLSLSAIHHDSSDTHAYFSNLPAATGASRMVCLGQISTPQ